MLKTIVKVSEVNNLSDARYCAGMGVEYIGFSMDNVPFEKYKEMRGLPDQHNVKQKFSSIA